MNNSNNVTNCDELFEGLNELFKNVSDISNNASSIQNTYEIINKKYDDINKIAKTTEDNMNIIKSKYDAISIAAIDINKQMNNINHKQEQREAVLTDIVSKITHYIKKQDDANELISKYMSESKKNLANLQDKCVDLSENINILENRIDGLFDKLSNITHRIDDVLAKTDHNIINTPNQADEILQDNVESTWCNLKDQLDDYDQSIDEDFEDAIHHFLLSATITQSANSTIYSDSDVAVYITKDGRNGRKQWSNNYVAKLKQIVESDEIKFICENMKYDSGEKWTYGERIISIMNLTDYCLYDEI